MARPLAIGAGATALMDLSSEVFRRTTGAEPLNYRLLGRWIGHMPRGRFHHESIQASPPVAHERELGWLAHYGIGAMIASALCLASPTWAARPTLAPALATGVATTAAPWFLMQPAFGMGLAGSKTPNPTILRLRTLRTHAIFGLALYLVARALPAR